MTTYWVVGENKSRRQERIATTKSLCPNSLTNTPCEEAGNISVNTGMAINTVSNTNPSSNVIDSSNTNAISHDIEEMEIATQNSPSFYSYMRPRWNGEDPTVESYYLKKEKNRRQDIFHMAHRNILIGSGSGSYDTDENIPENSPLLKTSFMDIDTDENLQVTPV